MDDDDRVGAQVKVIRTLYGLTQEALARRANVSTSLLSQVERGVVPASPGFLAAVARALDVPQSRLTGQPYRDEAADVLSHQSLAPLRRELAAYRLPPAADDPRPRPLRQLRASVAMLSTARHQSDLTTLGEVAPGLLAELRSAAHHLAPGPDRNAAYGLLAETYAAAGQLVWRLGHGDLSQVTTDRYMWATEQSGDRLAQRVGDYLLAGELAAVGEWTGARRTVNAAIADVESMVSRKDPGPVVWAVWGNLHLKAGLIAARAGDAATAWTHHREAVDAVSRLDIPERDDYRLVFGQTNVAIWRVGLAVELQDGAAALQAADDVRPPADYTAPERIGHHHIDTARAAVYHGDRARALEELLLARRATPQQTRNHPMVRETLHALAHAERHASGTLREMATWVGVDD
ncbi:helix-turn-helix domain-containing protein [Cryptosporangium sp. NPDC048952]|uniref:helix-turn-helix domain-containing protein n=1 Tax=Cryptosporangium sp. NPDC048952 TaxID=3363961 RepID=UPI0037153DF7